MNNLSRFSMDAETLVLTELHTFTQVLDAIAAGQAPAIVAVAATLIDALRAGHKVILFGNGGSAADAQHIAAELVGRYKLLRPALPAMALTTDTSALTAIGNDYGYAAVFARQVEAHARPGDVVIAISTSGNSPSVLEGVAVARRQGAVTIGLTGGSGGNLCAAVDQCLVVPSDQTPHIQQAHITIGHMICDLVERALFAPFPAPVEPAP
jgi:D-sedoheptulose 7-phosphate isomerase